MANDLGHLPPGRQIKRVIGGVPRPSAGQKGHSGWVQCAQALLELHQVGTSVLAVTEGQQLLTLRFCLRWCMVHAESRRIEASYLGGQGIRLNQVLPSLLLYGKHPFLIFSQHRQQVAQSIIGSIFQPNRPSCRLFQNLVMLLNPLFHPAQAMGAQMQHISQEKESQLTIAEPLPVRVWVR
ncbi:MAG: hypothetical protein DDT27_00096 [Dehalococcoidia bacterium]|nr:hypothetical protein [Chloroflexota bacterium]MBT9161566.1 hypothetical protein [Chloroflexota bacterium]